MKRGELDSPQGLVRTLIKEDKLARAFVVGD
jgi:hypothetical protein